MRLTSLTLLATAALTVAAPLAAQSKGAVRFRAHDVVPYDGYQIHVADFNNDGRLDVVPNTRPRSTSTVEPLQQFAPPMYFQASSGQVSAPNSPGRGIVRNVQRISPLRTS